MTRRKALRILSILFHPESSWSALGGAERRFIKFLTFLKEADMVILESEPSLLARFGVQQKLYTVKPLIPDAKAWTIRYVNWILWALRACLKAPSLIKYQKFEVVLAPNNTVPNLISAYFIHRVFHLPLCVFVHHIDLPSQGTCPDFPSVFRSYRKAKFDRSSSLVKTLAFFAILSILRQADMCIAVSSSTAHAIQKGNVPRKKVFVSGNGIDTEYIDSFKFDGTKLYDGAFLGRMSREKGVFDIIEAWKKIVCERPESKFIFIGSGPDMEKVASTVKELKLEKNILVKGPCPDEELYTLLKASRVFVFPSLFEGWGLSVGEALACGLPVICYDIPALREIFGGCSSVFFAPIGDTDALTYHIFCLLNRDENSLKRLGDASREYVKRFDWGKIVKKDQEIIETQIARESI